MRKLNLLSLALVAVLFGCGPSIQTAEHHAPRGVQFERRVGRHDIAHSAADLVASGYARAQDEAVDWTKAPYYVLINVEGEACIVSAPAYTMVHDGDQFACSWRRGAR